MTYTITAKNFKVSENSQKHINLYLSKLVRYLPHLNPNLPVLRLVIRRNRRRNFYHGSAQFVIPKKPLFVKFQGPQVEESLKSAFDRLFKELSTYKGKHFVRDSQYFNRQTIRRYYE